MIEPMTVEQLIKRLIAMPRDLRVVDINKCWVEDVYEDIKYFDDGHQEKVLVVN